jgi:DNA-binding transcriptional LysR family regulator
LPNIDLIGELKSIRQALTVSDYASISRAAHILGVRQSAVSRRVKALEDKLGVSLFERQPNGVRTTLAGQRFFTRTRVALDEIDRAIRNAAAEGRGAEGLIRIGISSSDFSDFLCDILHDFREANRGVIFDYFDWPSPKLIGGIMARRLDVAFVVSGTPAPGCDIESLWSAGICVALPDRHPLAGCETIDWELLKDEHFLFGREAMAAGLDDYASERIAQIGNRASLTTHDIPQDVVMRLVSRGFGVSLAIGSTARNCGSGIVFRPLAGEEKRVSYSAVWLPGNDNPALRRFLSLARSMSAERSRATVSNVSS